MEKKKPVFFVCLLMVQEPNMTKFANLNNYISGLFMDQRFKFAVPLILN